MILEGDWITEAKKLNDIQTVSGLTWIIRLIWIWFQPTNALDKKWKPNTHRWMALYVFHIKRKYSLTEDEIGKVDNQKAQ
jgi:hypothetical protein